MAAEPPKVVEICDGITKEILRPGRGNTIKPGDQVTCHCWASFENTYTKFWTTKAHGQSAFTFRAGVGQVIPGFEEGCQTMKQGEIAKLTMKSNKAYGPEGFPGWGIDPESTVVMEIEILVIKNFGFF